MPSEIIYQDDWVIGFRDIKPIAPIHLLIIPRKHIPTIRDLADEDLPLLGRMTVAANRIADEQGIGDGGYRLIINYGDDAGLMVFHIHMHLLGGRRLTWTA